MGLLPWAQEVPSSNLGAPTKLFKYLAKRSISLSEPGVPPGLRHFPKAHFAGKELQVPKRRVGRYPDEVRRMAVERFRACKNIVALPRELGVHRRLLYKWRDQFDSIDCDEEQPQAKRSESTLRVEVNRVKRLLAEKTLEVDFFKGALQKVEARRRQSGFAGEKASGCASLHR